MRYLNARLTQKYFRFRKTEGRRIEIILPVSILFVRSYWDVILHLPAEFCRNQTIGGKVMTSYRFFKMAAIKSEIYFLVQVS